MADKKISVLIIEDEQIFRTLALQVFEGCEKIVAANAHEGFIKFKEFCPDITLLDIGLPDQNGLDLLPQLISYDPEAFVVMLTMSRIADDVKLARERGAAGYIIKPFSHQKVAQCLAKYKEYKKQLQSMTPDDRAGKLIANLKIEALHDDLNQQIDTPVVKREDAMPLTRIDLLMQSWNILFADSILINRERAAMQLVKLGCRVEVAETSEEALGKASSAFYNIVLIDSKISGVGGYEVAKAIRKREYAEGVQEKAILIIMVENPDELDRRLWQKAGMDDFIRKPASFTKLREIILKHAKRKINYSKEDFVN